MRPENNFIFAIIFLLLLQLFFVGFYEKAGVDGYVYSLEKLNISNIDKYISNFISSA